MTLPARILQRLASAVSAVFTHPGVTSPEIEVHTEIHWDQPHRFVVSAPAGAIALVRELDDREAVVDLFLEPVVAFAITQYPQTTTAVRNRHDRGVAHGWHTVKPNRSRHPRRSLGTSPQSPSCCRTARRFAEMSVTRQSTTCSIRAAGRWSKKKPANRRGLEKRYRRSTKPRNYRG